MSSTPVAQALDGLSEATREKIATAEEALGLVQRSVTQRDWLNITQVLDRTRAQVLEDGGLRLLALAWVKEKAAHGGASWEVLLEMTDEDLLALHGFPTEDDTPDTPEEAAQAPQEAGEGDPWPGDPA
jgi:hypothetical protein